MCISTAYKHEESGDVLAENITTVSTKENSVTMTDIMGKKTVVEGTLEFADLTRGILIIEPA